MSAATDLMKEINAQLGTKALYIASDAPKQEVISTGLLPFDFALHGGFPRGRMSEVYGAPSALKSLLGLKTIAQAQAEGGMAALLDTERTFDRDWAERNGVDLSRLIIWPPEDDEDTPVTGENAMDSAEALLRSHQIDVLVFDSVAAALPQDLMGKRMSGENVQPGRLAALMSVGLRKLTAANTNTAVLWINQLRQNIGVTFGNPEAPPGGKSLPYYASVRVNIKGIGRILKTKKQHDGEKWADTKEVVAQKYKIEITKSKLFKPGEETLFLWSTETGQVDELSFLIAMGLEKGVVTQAGAFWQLEELKVRGRENFRTALPEHPDALARLVEAVMANRTTGSG